MSDKDKDKASDSVAKFIIAVVFLPIGVMLETWALRTAVAWFLPALLYGFWQTAGALMLVRWVIRDSTVTRVEHKELSAYLANRFAVCVLGPLVLLGYCWIIHRLMVG